MIRTSISATRGAIVGVFALLALALALALAAPVAAQSDQLSMFTLAGVVSEIMVVPAGEDSHFRSVTVGGHAVVIVEPHEQIPVHIGDCLLVSGFAVILDNAEFYRRAERIEPFDCSSLRQQCPDRALK